MIIPNPSRVWGIDGSHWNPPPIDFELLKLQGCKFVIIKACDGAVKTRYFEDHYQGAVKAGLVVMMYVWLYPANRVSIDSQVKAWADVYKSHPEIKLVWVDAEWTNYGGEPANPNTSDLTTAQNKLKAQIGNRTGDYTAAGYANQYLKGYVYNNPLWVANYDVLTPTLPTGASTWEFWQFADNVRSSVGYDVNYYNGTLEQFIAKYGGTVETPSPTGDKMEQYEVTAFINIRPSAGNTTTDLGDLLAGDVIDVDQKQNVTTGSYTGDWLHFTKITRFGSGAVVSMTGWCWGKNTKLATITPPPVDDTVIISVNGVDKYKIVGKLTVL